MQYSLTTRCRAKLNLEHDAMNPNIEKLHPYPFEKLALLKRGISPPAHLNPISLSIGEPTHKAPEFVKQTFSDSLVELNRYPTTRGTVELRDTIAQWLKKHSEYQV